MSVERRAQILSMPTEEPEQGAKVIKEVYDYIGRFVAYPSEHARVAHALWIVHAHLMDEWESTPRLAFLSPEPGSGKTRALEITESLVPNPVEAINATPAYIFRRISSEDGLPTILFDEIDTIFGPKAQQHEELRGVLNAGHRRGAMAGRCVVKGKEIMTEEFPAYAPVAVAGLGALPDTILTRAVVVRMRRRKPAEKIEAYRRRIHSPEGNKIRDRLCQWTTTFSGRLRDVWPDMPHGVEDRAADVWESLLAVADAAGGDWPKRSREAAVALVKEAQQSTPSLGVRLLDDLRLIFGASIYMTTEAICKALCGLDESPWADMKGKPIDARRLSRLLHQYGVSSTNVSHGHGEDRTVVKGYKRESLHDPWSRYLGPPAKGNATTATTATDAGEEEVVA